MKLNRKWLLLVALVLSVAMATTGTLAYLTDEDADVNTMTLGSVKIEQHEYQRVETADGSYETDTINDKLSYVLEDFEQDKPLMPATELDANGKPYNYGAGDYDSTRVVMSQVDSHGSMDVFVNKNAVDKFVTVENTGKSDAYVRTLIALEMGELSEDRLDEVIRTSSFMTDQGVWKVTDIGEVEIDGSTYFVCEYLYQGAKALGGVHENGVLPAGDTTYPSLAQVYMTADATNEDCEDVDGNKNGKYDILVLSQAVQVDGFEEHGAAIALNAGFGESTKENVKAWFEGVAADNALAKLAAVEKKDPKDANISSMMMVDMSKGFSPDSTVPVPEELDCCYTFTAAETQEEAAAGPYADWYADYIVSFDKEVPAMKGGLAGQYGSFEDGIWVGLVLSGQDVPANEEIPLLGSTGAPWTYPEICGGVQEFTCGAFDYGNNLSGTTLTVKLCLIDPTDDTNILVIREIKHTFE